MNIGTKVIRKSDANKKIPAFGIIRTLVDDHAGVLWQYGKSRSSVVRINKLQMLTPELEQEILAEQKKRDAEREAEQDKLRIYVCNNVNPTARGSLYGHPKPLFLTEAQVSEGKCFYCGHEVEKREVCN